MREHHSNPAMRQLANTSSMHSMEGERHNPLVFQILKNSIKCCKDGRAKSHACAQALDKVWLKWL